MGKNRRLLSRDFEKWPVTGQSVGKIGATIDDTHEDENSQCNPRLNLTGQGYLLPARRRRLWQSIGSKGPIGEREGAQRAYERHSG